MPADKCNTIMGFMFYSHDSNALTILPYNTTRAFNLFTIEKSNKMPSLPVHRHYNDKYKSDVLIIIATLYYQ